MLSDSLWRGASQSKPCRQRTENANSYLIAFSKLISREKHRGAAIFIQMPETVMNIKPVSQSHSSKVSKTFL